MRYPEVKESGAITKKAMRAIMLKLLAYISDEHTELVTQSFNPIDINKIRKFLQDKIKVVLPYIEKKIKMYVNRTYKNGLRASVTTNKTQKSLMPSDVKNIKRLHSYWINAFKSLTDEMKANVVRTVNQGLNNNLDPRTIKNQLKNLFEVDKKAIKQPGAKGGVRYNNRAEMIGRTLIVEGYSSARYDRDLKSGIVWGEEWFTAPGEKVCPICGGKDNKGKVVNDNPLDGQIVQMGKFFITTYKGKTYQVKYPPVHNRCRCRTEAVTYAQAKKKGLI